MNKHRNILVALALIIFLFPVATRAQFVSTLTEPFGGRVLTTKIPTVTCFGTGTGPVVLNSSISALGTAVSSSINGQNVGFSIASGIYNALPLYATNPSRVPKTSYWMLGRHQIIPSFSTCNSTALGGFPVPVKKTSNYGVSDRSVGF